MTDDKGTPGYAGRLNDSCVTIAEVLRSDRTELHNLANAQPEKAQELANKWETWAERTHVNRSPSRAKPNRRAKSRRMLNSLLRLPRPENLTHQTLNNERLQSKPLLLHPVVNVIDH
jgi:hypothetical protein